MEKEIEELNLEQKKKALFVLLAIAKRTINFFKDVGLEIKTVDTKEFDSIDESKNYEIEYLFKDIWWTSVDEISSAMIKRGYK